MTSGKYWLVDVIVSRNPKMKSRERVAVAKLAAISEVSVEGFEGIKIPPRTISFAFATRNDAIRWKNLMASGGIQFEGDVREYEGEIIGKG